MDRTRSPDHESDATPTTVSIASLYERCIHTFNQLYERLLSTNHDRDLLSCVEDEVGRFRVWAANAGAHRSGRVSLDHRLREAPHVHSRVSELIEEIQEDLENGLEITDGLPDSGPEWEISLGVDTATGSDEETEASELQGLLKDIRHIITSLYNVSIALRNPQPRERLAKFAAIDMSHFKPWDIDHIKQKFPRAPEYLIQRLGEANCKRRQFLEYYKNHHDKISRYIDIDIDIPITSSESIATSTVPQSQTTVTTVRPEAIVFDEVASDGDHRSQTSYATSTNQRMNIQVPPPPNVEAVLNGEPFQCPYCYQIIKIGNLRLWRKHVYRDIQPYVCTQAACQEDDKLYDSQYTWYTHEAQAHRREWYCNRCLKPFDCKGRFSIHLRDTHRLTRDFEIEAMLDMCGREKETPDMCIICGVSLTVEKVRKHLGQHMLDIALFTLPYPVADENPKIPIEGMDTSGNSVLELDSNPDHSSDSDGSYSVPGSMDGKLTELTLVDRTVKHDQREDTVAPYQPSETKLLQQGSSNIQPRNYPSATMSFEFGVGDFRAVGKLVWDVYRAYADAPEQFRNFSHEILALHAAMQKIEVQLGISDSDGWAASGSQLPAITHTSLSTKDMDDLKILCNRLQAIMKELDDLLIKYHDLVSSCNPMDRLKWGQEDLVGFRDKIRSNISMLTAFNASITNAQLIGIQKQLEDIMGTSGLRRRRSITSLHSVASFARSIGQKEAWKKLYSELHKNRVTADMIKAKKDEISKLFRTASVASFSGKPDEEEVLQGPETNVPKKAGKSKKINWALFDSIRKILSPSAKDK